MRLVHGRRHFYLVHAAAGAARPVHLAHVATAIAFATAFLGRATHAALRGGGVALHHTHRLAMHALRHAAFVHGTTGTPVFAHHHGWLGIILRIGPRCCASADCCHKRSCKEERRKRKCFHHNLSKY